MALRNMVKRKIRTILTVMGVVVGSSAITIMISLGVAVNMTFDEMIEEMGQMALRVEVQTWGEPGPFEATLNNDTLARINALPNVVIATPIAQTSLTFVSGRYMADLQIMGIEPAAMAHLGIGVAEGRGLEYGDEMAIVYSANTLSQFRNIRQQNMFWGMGGPPTLPNIDLLAMPIRASFDQNAVLPGESSPVRPYIVDGVGIMAASDDWMFSWSSIMPLDQVIEIERERWRQQQQQGGGGGFGGGMVMIGPGGVMVGGFGGGGNTFRYDEAFSRVLVVANDANNTEAVADAIREMGFNEHAVRTNTSWIDFQREQSSLCKIYWRRLGLCRCL